MLKFSKEESKFLKILCRTKRTPRTSAMIERLTWTFQFVSKKNIFIKSGHNSSKEGFLICRRTLQFERLRSFTANHLPPPSMQNFFQNSQNFRKYFIVQKGSKNEVNNSFWIIHPRETTTLFAEEQMHPERPRSLTPIPHVTVPPPSPPSNNSKWVAWKAQTSPARSNSNTTPPVVVTAGDKSMHLCRAAAAVSRSVPRQVTGRARWRRPGHAPPRWKYPRSTGPEKLPPRITSQVERASSFWSDFGDDPRGAPTRGWNIRGVLLETTGSFRWFAPRRGLAIHLLISLALNCRRFMFGATRKSLFHGIGFDPAWLLTKVPRHKPVGAARQEKGALSFYLTNLYSGTRTLAFPGVGRSK